MSENTTKPNYRSKEWMDEIRRKASAKRLENKKIKEAEKLKLQQERADKLKQADLLLNPPAPVESTPEPVVEKPKRAPRKRAEPRVALDIDTHAPTLHDQVQELKDMIANLKMEREQPPTAPPSPRRRASHPYDLAKADIAQHVNKQVLHNLWNTYFPAEKSPFDLN